MSCTENAPRNWVQRNSKWHHHSSFSVDAAFWSTLKQRECMFISLLLRGPMCIFHCCQYCQNIWLHMWTRTLLLPIWPLFCLFLCFHNKYPLSTPSTQVYSLHAIEKVGSTAQSLEPTVLWRAWINDKAVGDGIPSCKSPAKRYQSQIHSGTMVSDNSSTFLYLLPLSATNHTCAGYEYLET